MEALLLLGLLLLVLNVVEEDDVVIRNRKTKKETNVTSKLKKFINKLKKKLQFFMQIQFKGRTPALQAGRVGSSPSICSKWVGIP